MDLYPAKCLPVRVRTEVRGDAGRRDNRRRYRPSAGHFGVTCVMYLGINPLHRDPVRPAILHLIQ